MLDVLFAIVIALTWMGLAVLAVQVHRINLRLKILDDSFVESMNLVAEATRTYRTALENLERRHLNELNKEANNR